MVKKGTSGRLFHFSELLRGLRRLFSAFRHFLSGVSSAPFAKRYFIATPFLVLFFLIITFPLDIFVIRELNKMEGSLFKSFRSDSLSISPFRDWTAKSIIITTMQKSDITFSDVECSLGTLSLLTKKIRGTLSIASFSFVTETTQMNCVVNAVSSLDLDQSWMPSSGDLSLELSNISIKGLTIQGFNIPPVQIPRATASAVFSGRTMTIKDCSIAGKDLSGNIRGTVTPDRILGRSQLNLTIEIDSNSTLLNDYKPLLSTYINQSTGRLTITIQGQASSPNVNLSSQSQASVSPAIRR